MVEQHSLVTVEMGGQPALGQRHADRIGTALAQRTRRGLHAGGHPVFGVAGGLGGQLPELTDVLQADGWIAGRPAVCVDLAHARQVEQAVEQHRGVADREHEAVAIGPVWFVRIIAQEPAP